jgi:hypothetical protein
MIQETQSPKRHPAITSDQWHVVRARWTGDRDGEPRFERSIVAEHADRRSAAAAARALVSDMAGEMTTRTRETRDQVFVRRPNFRSLKAAKRWKKRRK